MDRKVRARFAQYPPEALAHMQRFRELILDVADNNPQIGALEETTKWGEPAYLTTKTGAGTTVRIDWKDKRPDEVAMFVNCQTTLLDQYRGLFPHLDYDGNRAVRFSLSKPLPEDEVRTLIDLALRYHLNKRSIKAANG